MKRRAFIALLGGTAARGVRTAASDTSRRAAVAPQRGAIASCTAKWTCRERRGACRSGDNDQQHSWLLSTRAILI